MEVVLESTEIQVKCSTVLPLSLQANKSNLVESEEMHGRSCSCLETINDSLKGLTINPKSVCSENPESCFVAGVVKNFIPILQTVVVQPLTTESLLYLGTPLFLRDTLTESIVNKTANYMFFGTIEDIFGTIGEPLYKVQVSNPGINHFKQATVVYYFDNNNNTRYMDIEHTVASDLVTVQHKIRTRKARHL